MEYYSAIKKNEIMSFPGKWMELKITTLSEISQTGKQVSHLQNLDLKNWITWVKTGTVWGGNQQEGEVNVIKVHYMHV
jgi:hypothetical protein